MQFSKRRCYYVHYMVWNCSFNTMCSILCPSIEYSFFFYNLLCFISLYRFHVIGLLVLFVQDFGDISLELSKCILYFKVRDGVECKFTDNLSNVSFGVFTLQWWVSPPTVSGIYVCIIVTCQLLSCSCYSVLFSRILLRLYWLPAKVLYSSCFVCVQFYPNGPFYLSFNVLLIALYLMQVYWFSFIVKLLVKMALTGETSVEDTRETEGEKEKVKKALKEEVQKKKKGM